MNQRIVSVVMVNWNGKETIQDCLDSVIGQTYPNVKLIVVENTSEDGSDRFVLEKYPSVRFIAFSENRGFAVGCNRSLRKTWAKRREVQSRIRVNPDRLEEFYDRDLTRTRVFQKW